MVFHVVHDEVNFPGSNVPDARLIDAVNGQLAVLNNEFNGPNPNTQGANPCIEFCLAQNTPDPSEDWLATYNSPTPGITRWNNPSATIHDGSTAAMTQLATVVQFPPDRYLNIWIVCAVIDGPLYVSGYGTFPGSTAPLDGVVIEYPVIAGGTIPHHLLGYYLVHEVGHYLDLYHTFNEGSCDAVAPGCIDNGDHCCDTPPVAGANTGGCNDLTPNSCGAGAEQLENYMDYAWEECQNTFTEDQIERMHATLLTFRSGLADPANHLLTGISGPDGCYDPELLANFTSNGTQFCTGAATAHFDGVLPVDEYYFTFTNPDFGTLPPVDYNNPGTPMTPMSGIISFPQAGPWTITLTVANSVTTPIGTSAPFSMTVYVSDCGNILMDQAQWYFGTNCALDFVPGIPTAIAVSAMNADEGCASTCDPVTGIMRFYTSNALAYNSGHVTLAPGLGQGVNSGSSSQGALLVPDPTSTDRHYLFSTGEVNAPGTMAPLHFGIVDITQPFGGWPGNIATASASVGGSEPVTTEHLSAVPACDGDGFWIVTHDYDPVNGGADQFLSYHLTAGGVVVTPAVTSPSDFTVGTGVFDGIGTIEFNHAGTLAAVTHLAGAVCQIYSFDRATGEFAFIMDLPGSSVGYGVAFSRSGGLLYTTTLAGIWQHDFRNFQPCTPDIPRNFTPFPNSPSITSLQLGPDDKIYMSNTATDFVSVINYPEVWNSYSNAFGFNWQGVTIEVPGGVNEICRFGLPNMIDAMPTEQPLGISWCSDDCENVKLWMTGCGTPISWDVYCNGSIDGTEPLIEFVFPGPGTYCVTLTAGDESVTENIELTPPAEPDIQPTTVCAGVLTTFSANNTFGLDHEWTLTGAGSFNGPTDGTTVEATWSGPGTLTLTVTDPVSHCWNSASINMDPVTFQPDLGQDVTVCPNIPTTLGETNGAVVCDWTPITNLTMTDPCAPVFSASTLGTYDYTLVAVDANGCVGTDDITITVDDSDCDVFTITKTASISQTYAWSTVNFTITICNNTGSPAAVNVSDALPTTFVMTGSNPFSGPITLPPGCTDFFITGYYTEIGDCDEPGGAATHTNTVTLTAGGQEYTASDCVDILVGCPMSVSGNGGCGVGDEVEMCLLVHTELDLVTTIDYQLVYPSWLSLPGNPAANTVGPISPSSSAAPLDANSTISWAPYDAQNNIATIHVQFQTAVNVAPPWSFLCMTFTINAPPPVDQNIFPNHVISPGGDVNLVTINSSLGILDFWTQAWFIFLEDCPSAPTVDASFTVVVPNCGGAVTVHGNEDASNAVHVWTWGDNRTTPTNGAPDWTYDYFSPFTVNQTPPLTLPPSGPGTYIITHTVLLDGAYSTSEQTITIYECCAAAMIIPDGSLASVVGSVGSGTVAIQGELIVDVDMLFQNCQVYMEPGAEIIVQSGRSLDINNASFTACDGVMWKAFTAESGSMIRIRDSYLDDAESTIRAFDGSAIYVDNTQFHNNRVGVGVPDMGLPYNNVACWVTNSTFYSAGTMPLPYAAQATAIGAQGFAAFDVHSTTLDLSACNNIIHSLSNGIVAQKSDVTVTDLRCMNIQPDAAYDYPGNGAGIFADGRGQYNYLKQAGYGASGMPSFVDCRWGVYTNYMNVQSTDNQMLNMGTAYRVERSGYRTVDILNNMAHTLFNGIDLRFNDGADRLLVQGNEITFGDDLSPGGRGYYGIYVSEGNLANNSSVIQQNIIHFLPQSNSRHGIGLFAADDWVVAENDLGMTSNAFNRTGIWTSGCRRPEVSCNTISSADNTYPIDAQAAIRNIMGSAPLISCNEMDQTANGILFNGVAYDTDVRGNQFHDHRWPLHLDATAIIDAQLLKGNLWDPGATAPTIGAWYEVLPVQAAAYRFWYNPITVGAVPPTWAPSNWFDIDYGVNYNCADHHGVHYCSQFGEERCKDCLRELDEKIANDELENNPYTDETKWLLAGDLYKKLDDAPELLDADTDLAAFYADLQGSTTAAFKAIGDDQLALYNLDNSVSTQLQVNRIQVESLMLLVKTGMAQLGDEALTTAQRQAILASLGGYRQTINSLTAWNGSALQLASSAKVLTAEGVRNNNANVNTSELIETNEKSVNEVYLNTVSKDVDGFTSAQASELFDIANQCPMVGGNAVFKARSLYWLIDDAYDFDDQLLCLQHGIIVKSMAQQKATASKVIPNPAGDQATLVLDQALEAAGAFVVYDAIGTEVMRWAVPIGSPRVDFSTARLAPAMYHYRVYGSLGVLGDGKLTIVR